MPPRALQLDASRAYTVRVVQYTHQLNSLAYVTCLAKQGAKISSLPEPVLGLRVLPVLHDAELRVLSTRASSLCHSMSVRLRGGGLWPPHNNSGKQHAESSNSLNPIFLPLQPLFSYVCPGRLPNLSAQLLVLLTSHLVHQVNLLVVCVLPGLGAVKEAASTEPSLLDVSALLAGCCS